jgi:hypothetical protein
VDRCAGLDVVIVPVDGSSLDITDDARVRGTGTIGARAIGARGFQAMNAIGVSPDGTPLGLLGQAWWSRPAKAPCRPARSRPVDEKETRYWLSVLESVRVLFLVPYATRRPSQCSWPCQRPPGRTQCGRTGGA